MNLDEIAHHPEAQVVTKFRHAGLECVVLNMRDRHYCGYVRTPFDGHWKEYDDAVSVHGGLSYGVDERGWIGFDTAHAFDVPIDTDGTPLANNPIAPLMAQIPDPELDSKDWDPEDVVDETANLAEEIAELAPPGELDVPPEIEE